MCRFVAYIGKESKLLYDILGKPENSLIKQSRQALETKSGLNGDGFGIGWYAKEIQPSPGVFKSTQPAWNDQNLKSLISLVRSKCFLGHIRAASVGDVSFQNCHPFTYENFLFVHNGTIEDFDKIRRSVIQELSDTIYGSIKGQTDSEHFFALILQRFSMLSSRYHCAGWTIALTEAIEIVKNLQKRVIGKVSYKLNIALTNGENLLVLKSGSPNLAKSLSLYLFKDEKKTNFLISSEKLWKNRAGQTWVKIPKNHFFFANNQNGEFSGKLHAF